MDQSKEVLVNAEFTSEGTDEPPRTSVRVSTARRSTIAVPKMRNIKLKKLISYGVIAMFLFLTGVQYVLILPTASDYIINKLGGNNNLYGFVMAAFSLSALFSNLLFGWLSDGVMSVRLSATICNVFLLVGSFMYFMGINVWLVMLSRLISGVGTGAGASYWADLARYTPESEKTQVFAVIMMFRQLGVVVGPAFNLLFTSTIGKNEYKLGPFDLNVDSVPGLFMAVVWVIMLLFCLFGYTDLEHFADKKKHTGRRSTHSGRQSVAGASLGEGINARKSDVDAESVGRSSSAGFAPRVSVVIANVDPNFKPTWRDYFYALAKEDVLCLQFVLFISGFVQTAMEAQLPPMSYTYIEWGENATSMWFLISGLVTIGIFLLVSGPLSRLFHDYWLTQFGVFIELFSFPFLIAMAYFSIPCCDSKLGRLRPNDPTSLALLLAGFGVNTIGLPFIGTCTVSLFSNAVPEQYQGMAHGIRRSLSFLGYLLGPIWGGAYLDLLGINFISLLVMYAISCLMLFASKGSLFR